MVTRRSCSAACRAWISRRWQRLPDILPPGLSRGFVYEPQKSRVIFGRATVQQLPEEARRLRMSRPLILSTPEQAHQAVEIVRASGLDIAGSLPVAQMHTPVDVTERAVEQARQLGADGLIAIGGGSTIGLGKAIATRTGLDQIAVPTTYAGSEMTPILGETAGGQKTTRRDPSILPETVIYDVDLTLGLPAEMSAISGLNAIAHAVEALYANDRNPIVEQMAEAAITALGHALPAILREPGNIAARTDALYGAWLCGACLGQVSMALHHKLCHVLGGAFDLPHAQTHAIILPHATA
ncbi:MAG: maleylacetate reductase, partial [Rhodospirillales bacterium]|nr:maleylacetate reductase [Rhodospirillales bacterium]